MGIPKYESKYGYLPLALTASQENIINGILLGDAWVEGIKRGGNTYLRCEHSIKDQQYVQALYDQ